MRIRIRIRIQNTGGGAGVKFAADINNSGGKFANRSNDATGNFATGVMDTSEQQWQRMRSSLVVRASDCQCTSWNGPGFDPNIRQHSGIWGAADEAVLNTVWKKIKKSPQKNILNKKNNDSNIKMPTPLQWHWVKKCELLPNSF